jgi:hypothetical protein
LGDGIQRRAPDLFGSSRADATLSDDEGEVGERDRSCVLSRLGCTAPDTACIVILHDIDAAGHPVDVTAGFLRAGLRKVDEIASKPGAPVLPCVAFEATTASRSYGSVLIAPAIADIVCDGCRPAVNTTHQVAANRDRQLTGTRFIAASSAF